MTRASSYARAALAAADAVRHAVDEHAGLLRGRVTLGLVPGATEHAFGVASFLAAFHDAHPGLEIALTEDTSERMQTALLAGEIDIALLGPPGEEPPPGLSYRTVIDAPLGVAVAAGDPLLADADRTDVPLTDLRDRPLICLPQGTGARAALERACAQAGFGPRIAFEAAAPHVLAQLAVRGWVSPSCPSTRRRRAWPPPCAPCRSSGPGSVPVSSSPGRQPGPQARRPGRSSTGCTTPCRRHPRRRAGRLFRILPASYVRQNPNETTFPDTPEGRSERTVCPFWMTWWRPFVVTESFELTPVSCG